LIRIAIRLPHRVSNDAQSPIFIDSSIDSCIDTIIDTSEV
jgi:hypothetical protein